MKANRLFGGELRESVDGKGFKWLVRLIFIGESLNKRIYTRAVLEEALPLFEGTKAFLYARRGDRNINEADHLANLAPEITSEIPEGLVPNIAGNYTGVHMRDDGLYATLNILESEGWLAEKLNAAWKLGKNFVGLSIYADAVQEAVEGGRMMVKKFLKVFGVDIVAEPAAGGSFVALQESLSQKLTEATKIMEWLIALKAKDPGVYAKVEAYAAEKKLDLATLAMDALSPELAAAVKAAMTEAKPEEKKPEPAPAKTTEADKDAAKAMESRQAEQDKKFDTMAKSFHNTSLNAKLDAAKLPAKARAFLYESFKDKRETAPETVDAAIVNQRDIIAESMPKPKDGLLHITDLRTQRQAVTEAVIGMLKGTGANRFKSPRQALSLMHGGRDIVGEGFPVTESVDTTSWSGVFVDAIHKYAEELYIAKDEGDWKKLARIRQGVTDFKSYRSIRVGGYANITAVSEKATPPAMTTPGTESVSWAVGKYSGLESISYEAMRNDDLGEIQSIPQRIAEAALQTFREFFYLDIIEANPNFEPDAVAIYHATHSNLGSTSVGETGILKMVAQIRNQTNLTNGKKMNLQPRYILVPQDTNLAMEKAVDDVIGIEPGREAESDNAKLLYAKKMNLSRITVPWFVDVDDYYMFTDAKERACIEVGFLDGKEAPEVVQLKGTRPDGMTPALCVEMQVLHIYGGEFVDFRGTAKQAV